MTLTDGKAIATTNEVWKSGSTERARLRRLARYARGKQQGPWLPDGVESEYRDIAKKSASNWLGLVVAATSQGLYVDSYGDDTDTSVAWQRGWQANGMDARQSALHDAVGTLGYSYLFLFPGDDAGTDKAVWIRPEAATKVTAVYDDPSDEWPRHVVREVGKDRFELYTDEARYTITGAGSAKKVTVAQHDAGVCPVVRFQASLDLLGHPMGDVEPVISIQDRIVDATFTLQMVAKYGAFPQKWIAGINPGEPLRDANGDPLLDANGNPIMPTIKAYIDHILMAADHETKFGTFEAAALGQYVEALEAHIRHLAAITQTPPHYLLGSLVNLSAEALAAAEAGLQRKIRQRREVLGEAYEQALRLAAIILGDVEAGADLTSQVHWQDVESRSLAQVADALVKLQTIGVPLPMLLQMIPGFTKTDVDDAIEYADKSDGLAALAAEMAAAREAPTPVAVSA